MKKVMKKIAIIITLIFTLGYVSSLAVNKNVSYIYEITDDSLMKAIDVRHYAINELKIIISDKMSDNDINLMVNQCNKYNIPLKYVIKLIKKESNFNPNAVNKTDGSSGYMQLHPPTYASLKKSYVKEGNSLSGYTKSEENIILGTYLINRLYKKYNNWHKVFMAYNGGPGAVDKNSSGPFKYANSILY